MPNTPTPLVGIDLGTVYSVIAHLDADGRPVSIPNAEGDILTPSVVLFDQYEVVVGKEAVRAATLEPDRVAAFAKRDMGEREYGKTIGGQHLPPEVIQSFVLRKLKNDASLLLGPVERGVITVPAYFNEPRRKATQDAGRLAGLQVIDIINEPTAAAIAYGVHHGFLTRHGVAKAEEKILVYDLGGGTFDVTLMHIVGRSYTALATAGDVYLGGFDWDQKIVDFIAGEFLKKQGLDPREDPCTCERLRQDAEQLKRALSVREEVRVTFEFNGRGIQTRLSRAQFEEMSADLLERTRFTCRKLLQDAGCRWSDLTRVLLTGGSTRMPQVGAMLQQESGKVADRSLSPDEAVAHGAAIYAGIYASREAGERPLVSVTNVNSHNLGVLGIEPGTGRPRNKVLVPRNSPLPISKRGKFVTHRHDQRSVRVQVIEGGDASGANSTLIGTCVVRDLPPNLPHGTPVEVSFNYAQDGRLTVEAHLPAVGKGASMTIERASGLSEEQLNEWQLRIAEGRVIAADKSQAGDESGEASVQLAAEPPAGPSQRKVPKAKPLVDTKPFKATGNDDLFPDDLFPDDTSAGAESALWDDDQDESHEAQPPLESPLDKSGASDPSGPDEPVEEIEEAAAEALQGDDLVIGSAADEPKKLILPDDDTALGEFLKKFK